MTEPLKMYLALEMHEEIFRKVPLMEALKLLNDALKDSGYDSEKAYRSMSDGLIKLIREAKRGSR